jgi:hypothetical protein
VRAWISLYGFYAAAAAAGFSLSSVALYYRRRCQVFETDLRVILWNSDKRQSRMAFQSLNDCVSMVNTYARRALDEATDSRARLDEAALSNLLTFIEREETARQHERAERRDARA